MAGAGKSKHSKEARENRERYGKRRYRIRDPKPVVAVICDDAKTAVAYFSILKRLVKENVTVHVKRNPADWATAQEVIAAAKSCRDSLLDEAARDESDLSAVWALIDLEQSPQRRSLAFEAQKIGQASGIAVALSDPCYELWTLLHLLDTGEEFANCSAVISRLESVWKGQFEQEFGPKAQADYSKIMLFIGTAIQRAKRRHEAIPRSPSWTEVYKVVELILSFGG